MVFFRRTAAIVSLLAVTGALTACGLVKKPAEACSVTIAPRDLTVPVNGSTTVIGTAFDCDGNSIPKKTITFSSSNAAIATITQTGAVIGISVGTTTVAAVANGKSGIATVTVTPERVATITINPATITLRRNNIFQFTAVSKNSQGTVIPGIAYQWASSNSSLAAVDNTGKVTALAPGPVVITATADGQTGNAQVIITEIPIGSCTLAPTTQRVTVGQQVQPTLTLLDTASHVLTTTGRAISWTTDNELVASVSATGAVLAKKAGTAKITAVNPENSAISCFTTIEVVDPRIVSVRISPVSAVLRLGAPRQYSVTLIDSVGGQIPPGRIVSWRNVTPSIATVTPSGVVTGIALGTGRIAVDAEGAVDTVSFTVTKIPVASITIAPLQRTVTEGQTAQFTATVTDTAGAIVNDRTVEWLTSDGTKATVSNTGLATALGAGTVSISANVEGKAGSATLVITQVPVDSIRVVNTTFTLKVGATSQFAITPSDAAGNPLRNRNVIVTSDQPNIATGTSAAAGSIVTVTGVSIGTTTLTIQAVNSNNQNEGKATKVIVTVTP